MRRLLAVLVVGLLVTCLVILGNRPLREIKSGISLTFGAGNTTSKCNGRVPDVILPKSSLTPAELALVVNDRDPQSIAVANYYQRDRHIPAENIIHVRLQPNLNQIEPAIFQAIKSQIDGAIDAKIQAIALSFSRPFRVGCMSITSAIALGYDNSFCQQPKTKYGCRYPQFMPYYNSDSVSPFADFGIRPTMMLAGENLNQVMQLIDRGVASDATFPQADAHLIKTSDQARSTRSSSFSALAQTWYSRSGWTIKYRNNEMGEAGSDFLTGNRNVLFYFTGLANVPQIATNSYLPGAIADHLTSAGGVLFGGSQMSILNWLKAGTTASYGTVVEPCNFPAKFPDPEVMIRQYYTGQTALEAYWKSVAAPQEGVFVGEPLAQPMGVRKTIKKHQLSFKLSTLKPGKTYQVYAAKSADGSYFPMSELIRISNYQMVEMNFGCEQLYYKLVEVQEG